jgi:hypothetical protein
MPPPSLPKILKTEFRGGARREGFKKGVSKYGSKRHY